MNRYKQFEKYSDYYDAFYQNKDYKKEVMFLEMVMKKYSRRKVKDVLSLGCGTANHDIILAKKGFKIFGIDKSKAMLKIAGNRAKKSNLDIKFKHGDVRNFKVNKKFDFAMAMFNVIGYQIENQDIEKTLKSIYKTLKKDSLFVFDCWYGPAVLKGRPFDKIKKIRKGSKEIVRATKQKLDIEKSIIDINFEVSEKINKSNAKIVVQENHKMRFWYLQELKYFLRKNGFALTKVCNFLDLNSKISEKNWDIFVIARKT